MSFTSGDASSYTPIGAGKSPFDKFNERNPANPTGSGQYAHPPDLLKVGDDGPGIGRPVVIFRNLGEQRAATPASVFILPIPGGLEMKESANYDDSSLGLAGSNRKRHGAECCRGWSDVGHGDAIVGGLRGAVGALKNWRSSLKSIAVGAADKIPLDAGGGVGIGLGTAVNKYVTTEFTGVATRAFGFAFTLYPKSQSEANHIKDMVYALRIAVYPWTDNPYLLRYPPTWSIDFVAGGEQLKHIPRIFECYLTDVSVTYNGKADNWYDADAGGERCTV